MAERFLTVSDGRAEYRLPSQEPPVIQAGGPDPQHDGTGRTDRPISGAKIFIPYVEILNMHLVAIGREDLIDHDVDIGTQLEFGVSSRTLLSLIELGLSRVSAVALYERIARDDLSKEDCVAWVSERDTQFEGMEIPAIILRGNLRQTAAGG